MKFLVLFSCLCLALTLASASTFEISKTDLVLINSTLDGVELISARPVFSTANTTHTTHFFYIVTKNEKAKESLLSITPVGFRLKKSNVISTNITEYIKTIDYVEEEEIIKNETYYDIEYTVVELNSSITKEKNISKIRQYSEITYVNKTENISTVNFSFDNTKIANTIKSDAGSYLIEITTEFGEQGSFNPNVSACAELNESDGIYNLTQNVSIDGSTCFTITAPNVTLDCNGYSITGDNSSTTYGVYSTQPNTTIKNCQISNFTYASYLTSGASNSLITSCALYSTASAALQINAVNATVKDSNISTLSDTARTIQQVGDNATYINVTSDGSRRGLETSIGVISLTLVGCNLSGSYSGLNLGASDANTLAYNSTITRTGSSTSTGVGSVMFVGENNNLTLSNTSIYSKYGICINALAQNASLDCQGSPITGANTSSSYGVYSNQANTTIQNCNISNFATGIYLAGDKADDATITDNTINLTYSSSCSGISNGPCNGIYVNGGDNATIARNNVSTYQYGINIYSNANDNRVLNNSVTVANGNGITVRTSSTNLVDNNAITSNGDLTIYLYSSAVNNNITNNRVNTTARAIQFSTNSNNNFIANNTLNVSGGTSSVIRFIETSLSNILVNNTLISTSSGDMLSLASTAGGNLFYQNNLSGSIWINDLDGTNLFNSSGIGNIYYFANGTPSWEVYAIYTNDSDNWADYGANRPFNSSLAEWSGSGADWHPYTLNTNYSIRITQNVSFTNATVGHWFYANATAYNPAGYNQTSNISASSGTCSLVSSTQTNWTLAVVYNCTAQTPSTATINITFFDVYQVRNSTQANNSYADPNIPVLTAPNISGTASVGYTLTCNAGNFSDADGDIENVSATTWRWFNGTTPIANATSQTWLVPLWYNGAVIKCEQNVTAQNWTTSQASNNSSAVTISNANPVNATLENMINATTSHQFNITAYADDADGGQDITVWNLTSTHGTCSFLSNTTGGNRRTVLINCYAQSEGTTELNITFADFNGLYNWTAKNFTYIDHEANLSAPFITPISNNSAENLTCNLGNWSDIDGDLENTSARSFRWFVNGLDINVSAQVLANGNFTTGDYISCEQFSIAQNWTTSNITVNSTEIYISNQSVNLVIVSPYNGSLISSCNFTALIFTGFQNGTTSRTATCNLSYNGQFITTQTKNVSNGFSTYVFYNLTNNGNYSITCQAQDSFSVSQTVSVHTQYYDMTACYADFYKKTSNTTTTFLYSKFEIEYFNVSEVLGVMLLGLAMFGMVSYATRLRKGNIFAAQS